MQVKEMLRSTPTWFISEFPSFVIYFLVNTDSFKFTRTWLTQLIKKVYKSQLKFVTLDEESICIII